MRVVPTCLTSTSHSRSTWWCAGKKKLGCSMLGLAICMWDMMASLRGCPCSLKWSWSARHVSPASTGIHSSRIKPSGGQPRCCSCSTVVSVAPSLLWRPVGTATSSY
jgi:hypothetical protein